MSASSAMYALLTDIPGPAPTPSTLAFRFNTLNPDTVDPAFTVSAITAGPGVGLFTNAATDVAAYATTPVLKIQPAASTTTTIDAAVTAGCYIEFTVNRADGAAWDPQRVRLKAAKGGSGIRGFDLRSSVDNYAASIIGGAVEVPTTRPTWSQYDSAMSLGTVTGPVTFRIFVFSRDNASSVEFDDIEMDLAVVSVTSATPATQPSTTVFGAASLTPGPVSITPATAPTSATLGASALSAGSIARTPATIPPASILGMLATTQPPPATTVTPATTP